EHIVARAKRLVRLAQPALLSQVPCQKKPTLDHVMREMGSPWSVRKILAKLEGTGQGGAHQLLRFLPSARGLQEACETQAVVCEGVAVVRLVRKLPGEAFQASQAFCP